MHQKTWPMTVAVLAMATVFSLVSCEEHGLSRATPGDYFPLGQDHRWEYIRTHSYWCVCADSGLVLIDTMHFRTEPANGWAEDFTLLSEFNPLNEDEHWWSYKIVRKKDGSYFEQPAYDWEYKFLDADMPLHGSWPGNPESFASRRFTITGVDLTKTVRGETYTDVIEVTEETFYTNPENEGAPFSKTVSYYAKDVGLIYSLLSYTSDASTMEFVLLNHRSLKRIWK